MSLMDTYAPNVVAFQSLALAVVDGVRGIFSAAAWSCRRVVTYYSNRQVLSQMSTMGFSERRDIGVTSADLTYVSSLPFGADATGVLAQVVEERRRAALEARQEAHARRQQLHHWSPD